MSNFPPRRFRPGPPPTRRTDFNWPPTDEELEQSRAETVQRLERYLQQRPADEDPQWANDTERRALERPPVKFNWLPTEEERAQVGVETGHSESMFRGDAAAVETPEPLVGNDLPPAPAFFENVPVESAASPDTETPTAAAEAEDLVHADVEDSKMGGAAAQSTIEPAEVGEGDWAAEIARLQELMDGLTEKLGWRVTNAAEQ
jgi:hypothetical protein